jgi:hypothetical protein
MLNIKITLKQTNNHPIKNESIPDQTLLKVVIQEKKLLNI